MKTKKILLGIVALMLFVQVIPVDAYSIIKEEFGMGHGHLNDLGFEWYQRIFYSNYSKMFYAFFGGIFPGWPNYAGFYSYSPDGVNWAQSDHTLHPFQIPGFGWTSTGMNYATNFYLTPDGKHFYYVYEGSDDDALYWGKVSINQSSSRLVNNVTATIIMNGQYGGGPPGNLVFGSKEIDTGYSIVVDDLNYVYIGMELVWSTTQHTYVVIKSNGPDQFNFEDFGDVWGIETEWINNGHANPSNTDWKGALFPLRDNGFIEDIGLVFCYDELAGAQELHRSMYYDNSTDDWIDFTGNIFNDAEGGDWRDDQWDLGWSSDIAVVFKQDESKALPDRIEIDAVFLNIPTRNWENRTDITWEELGDAGAISFMPQVNVREGTNAVNFYWSISGNDTIWERRMFPNGTLEDIRILETGLQTNVPESKNFGDPNVNGPSPYSWFVDGGTIAEYWFPGDFILMNFTMCLEEDGGEEDWEPIYSHDSTTLFDAFGNQITDDWLFEGEVYDLVSVVNNVTSFDVQTYDTRHNITFRFNNATEQTWIDVTPSDQFTIGLPWSNITRDGTQTTIRWRFILDRSIVDCLNQTWAFFMENSFYGPGIWANPGIVTNIYNLGGFTNYTFTADGYRTPGGHPFEIYAINGTDGGFARAEQIYRKLQSVHFLVELDLSNEWDAGNGEFDWESAGHYDIGIDYRINGTWIQGWFVRLSIRTANIGHHNLGADHNWVEWNVDWYNYNATLDAWHLRRQGTVITNHWGYDNENLDPDYHNRTTCQLWIDLWFDRTNSSATVAGQVNAMYHGMKEHGSSWWFGYGDFQPMISEYGNSQYLDDLNVQGFNVTSMDLDLMRVYVAVDKWAVPDGDDEPWGVRAIENFNRKEAEDRMQGIEQPAFEETLVLDMPMYQSNNPLIRAIDGISIAIWKGALTFQKILWAAMDSFFEWAGFGAGFFSQITAFIMMLPDIFLAFVQDLGEIMTAIIPLFEEMFRFFASLAPSAIQGLLWLAGSLTEYWDYFQQIMQGSGPFSNLGNLIYDMQLGDWLRAGIAMLPAYEILSICFSNKPGRKARYRIKFYTGLYTGLTKFVMGMIEFLRGAISVIMDILPG